MRTDVLLICQRTQEPSQLTAVAFVYSRVIQNKGLPAEFMEWNHFMGEQCVSSWQDDQYWITPDWFGNDPVTYVGGMREPNHEIA